MNISPNYLHLHRRGELAQRIQQLNEKLKQCDLCPRKCGVNRISGEPGFCQAGATVRISSAFPHLGEEPELVGFHGSGTIFLTHCNLRCIFCQNDDISHGGIGQNISIDEFARQMIHLQQLGCHNINFVTPTHYTPQIIEALALAIEWGLEIPLVYNCSGYESLETLRLLDGIIDIYMPDAKFYDKNLSQKYCHANDYFEVLQSALLEMQRQVGNLVSDKLGIAHKGLLIRHLVMPNHTDDSIKILEFIATQISPNAYVNIMGQYHPSCRAHKHSEINRRISRIEMQQVFQAARNLGLHRGF